MFDDNKTGIVIDKYPSIAVVVKVLRKYTDDSIIDIKNHIENGEFALSYKSIDDSGIRKLIKCTNELKKNKVTVKIYEGNYEESLQYLKNLVHSYRETEIQIEAETELEVGNVDETKLEEFKELWAEGSGYVVLKDEYNYSIYNPQTHYFCLIEDEDLNNQVAATMIMHGCKVIDGKEEIAKLIKESND